MRDNMLINFNDKSFNFKNINNFISPNEYINKYYNLFKDLQKNKDNIKKNILDNIYNLASGLNINQPANAADGLKINQLANAADGLNINQPANNEANGLNINQPANAANGLKINQPANAANGLNINQPANAADGLKINQPANAADELKINQPANNEANGLNINQPANAADGLKINQLANAADGLNINQPANNEANGLNINQLANAADGLKINQLANAADGLNINQPANNSIIEENINILYDNFIFIFTDNIYSSYNKLLNLFLENNNDLINYFNIKNKIIYKSNKYYCANRFSSVIEYYIMNFDIVNNNFKKNEEFNNIVNIKLLFFICMSYALIDTYVDNEFTNIKPNKNDILKLSQYINNYFNYYIYKNTNIDLINNIISNIKHINKYYILLVNLLEFCDINKLSPDNLYIIYQCFNIEINSFYYESKKYNEKYDKKYDNIDKGIKFHIQNMIKKGMSSLLLSFLTKNNYLNSFITNNETNNEKYNSNLCYDFGICGQLIDDICDFNEDINNNKVILTTFNISKNNISKTNISKNYISNYINLIYLYLYKINEYYNYIKLNNILNHIKETELFTNFNFYIIFLLYGLNKNKKYIKTDAELYKIYNLLWDNKYDNIINNFKNKIKNIIK